MLNSLELRGFVAHAVDKRPAIRNQPGHRTTNGVGDAVHGSHGRRVQQAVRHLLLRDDANRVTAPNPDARNSAVLDGLERVLDLVKAALRRKHWRESVLKDAKNVGKRTYP